MRTTYTPLVSSSAVPNRGGVAIALGSAGLCVAATILARQNWQQRSRLCMGAEGEERLGDDLMLGDIRVGASRVLLASSQTAAYRGLRPIVEGHCVVAPRRSVGRVSDLSDAEWLDLWRTVRRVQATIESEHGAEASNLLLKDGTARLAGHAHAHVVPRFHLDFARNDDVFDAMDRWAPSDGAAARLPAYVGLTLPSDEEREDRTSRTMADEASSYRALVTSGGGGKGGGGAGAAPIAAHTFSRFPIASEHCFYESASKLTVAFVNLRPLVAGHVLVTPRRIVPRMCDLTADEHDDLWSSVRVVQRALQSKYAPKGFELGVQDGKLAGQSVPHVHVHVLPHA